MGIVGKEVEHKGSHLICRQDLLTGAGLSFLTRNLEGRTWKIARCLVRMVNTVCMFGTALQRALFNDTRP